LLAGVYIHPGVAVSKRFGQISFGQFAYPGTNQSTMKNGKIAR
jgi:hypothetical protein